MPKKKTEEPKVEEPKVEEPKVEEPKVEEPKVEEPKKKSKEAKKTTPIEAEYVFIESPRIRKDVVSIADVVIPAGSRKRVVTTDRMSYVLNDEEFAQCVVKK